MVAVVLAWGRPATAVTALFQRGGGPLSTPFPLADLSKPLGGLDVADFAALGDGPLVRPLLEVLAGDGGGFSQNGGIFFPLDGAVDAASLPATVTASMTPKASVWLMGIQPGRPDFGLLYPTRVSVAAAPEGVSASHLLVVVPRPDVPLEPDTWYAAVLTNRVLDEQGHPLEPALGFVEAFVNTKRGGGVGFGLKLLQDVMTQRGLDPRQVAAATVFQTGDPMDEMRRLGEHLRTLPPPSLENVAQVKEATDHCVLEGMLSVPRFIAEEGGRLLFRRTGEPAKVGEAKRRVLLTIPKQPVPGPGWPTVVLSGVTAPGEVLSGSERLSALSAHGLVTMSFADEGLSVPPVRVEPPDLYTVRDGVRQRAVAVLWLSLLPRQLNLPDSLCPDAQFKLRFSPIRVSVWSHGGGVTVGALALAMARTFQSGVFSGEPVTWHHVVGGGGGDERLGWRLARWLGSEPPHPLWTLLDTAGDKVDPLLAASLWNHRPAPGWLPKHVLLLMTGDAAQQFTLAGGVDVAGEASPQEREGLAVMRREPTALPLKGNRTHLGPPVTAVKVTPQTTGADGPLPWTGGQFRQAVCFLWQSGVEKAPEVLAPEGQAGDRCPGEEPR